MTGRTDYEDLSKIWKDGDGDEKGKGEGSPQMTVVKYYDLDKQQERSRRFNDVEKKRMIDIFGAINKVLADYHHPCPDGNNEIQGYLPNIATCSCGRPITFYDIRLKSSVISMPEIHDIARALDELGVALININANFRLKRFSLYIGEIHDHNHDDITEAEVELDRIKRYSILFMLLYGRLQSAGIF